MSYDVELDYVSHGGGHVVNHYQWNYTSNCARMWKAADLDLNDFDGKHAMDCVAKLRAAIFKMEHDPDKYRAMNPRNGWGDYDSLLRALNNLADAMKNYPLDIVSVWS